MNNTYNQNMNVFYNQNMNVFNHMLFSAIKESEGAEYQGKIEFSNNIGHEMIIKYDLTNQIDPNKKFIGNYVLELPYQGSVAVFAIDLVTKLLNES